MRSDRAKRPIVCPECGKRFSVSTSMGNHTRLCPVTPEQLFWAKVIKAPADACWQWKGSVTSHGYGNLTLYGKTVSAHQAAYRFCVGEVPAGLIIRHKCDNRLCCNPGHMELGTKLDNAQDKSKRGRTPKRHTKRLTPEQVREIRAAQGTLSSGDIMLKYGVTRSHAFHIWGRKVWKHI